MHELLFKPEYFDPKSEWTIVERRLPHWTQAGVLTFITFRTFGSIPERVLKGWHAERAEWLRDRGLAGENWRQQLEQAQPDVQFEYHRRFSARWESHLDSGYGDCVLRRPELAQIVGNSLRHFDGERYVLTDFIVMPNHVHLLAAFPSEAALLEQCESWKHFTATQINRVLSRKGRFWQQDGFDHLIRSEAQLEAVQRYIAQNPLRVNLRVGEYLHFSNPQFAASPEK